MRAAGLLGLRRGARPWSGRHLVLLRAQGTRKMTPREATAGRKEGEHRESADGDWEDHKGKQLQAGHGFSHPRTPRAARCNMTEAPIQKSAPRITALGG